MRLQSTLVTDWRTRLAAMAAAAMFLAPHAFAQDAESGTPAEETTAEEAVAGDTAADEELSPQTDGKDPDQPRSMSGMSILGNEEAPKSLVIIPWKSSQLGDDIDLEDSLDDQATPVDKEVFMRELSFYEIRAGH